MGSRGLPRQKALALGGSILLALAAAIFAGAGIAVLLEGDDPAPAAPAGPDPTSSPTVPRTHTPTPATTPTPDPVGAPPRNAGEALRAVERLAAAGGPVCRPALKTRWDADCLEADFDADGRPDSALLIPVAEGHGLDRAAVVVVRRATGGLSVFPPDRDADASALGRGAFLTALRSGSGRATLQFVSRTCGAASCQAEVEVVEWDGTSWRGIGPSGLFDGLDQIVWSGSGAASQLTIHSLPAGPIAAGPMRGASLLFGLRDGRYRPLSSKQDAPVYLFHALLDADIIFDRGDFAAAVTAYTALLSDSPLRDWRAETGAPPGRPSLASYARFRVAVALAASGAREPDVVRALDAAVLSAGTPVFAEAATAFRRGWQEGRSAHEGCIDTTVYLKNAQDQLRAVFDYGYANVTKNYLDICPL